MQSQHPPSSRFARWGTALATAVLLGLLPLLGAPANAAQSDKLSWSIKPGGEDSRTNFSYELEAGDTKKDTFEVTNLGSAEISLAIYAADGTTSSSGALDLLPADEPSTVVGAWVMVKQPEITLSPGETESVDFTLRVPKDTEPGDYVGGLISSYVDLANGGTVVVDQRLASRMNVRVGGEGTLALQAQALAVTTASAWNPFAPTTATASFILQNTGAVRARSNYTITTSGIFGWGENSKTFASGELIPGGSVDITQQVGGLWPLLILDTKVSVFPEGIDGSPGTEHILTASGWAMPWGQLVLLVVIISIALFVGLRRGRYYKDDEEDEFADANQSQESTPTGRRASIHSEPGNDA